MQRRPVKRLTIPKKRPKKSKKRPSKARSLTHGSLQKSRRSYSSLVWSLIFVSIVGVVLFSVIIFLLIPGLPAQGWYTKPVTGASSQVLQNLIRPATVKSNGATEYATSGLPIRLIIPKIHVDTTLEQVGLTAQGAVGVPKVPMNAAWFDQSPHPGDTGSAIISGHFGLWKNGMAGVFNNLYTLQQGDKLYVRYDTGTTVTFVVREIKLYDPTANATDVFVSPDGKAHLNLITCEGAWDPISKSYSKRLVAFTDKEMN